MEETKQTSNDSEVLSLLKSLASGLAKINERVERIETGGRNDFKKPANPKDIEVAKASREGVDPRIIKIVEETLGSDFRVKVEGHKDRPGFLFTVVVPERLSSLKRELRPKVGEDGEYVKDTRGNVLEEEYFPEDARSRAIASSASYDSIKDHCERVRANVVSYFQKTNKPLPEFNLNRSGV